MSTGKSKHEHKGSGHWRLQRIWALALIPLSLWFLFSIIGHIGADYQVVSAWVAHPLVSVFLALYLVFMLVHAQLGIEVVMEDYVQSETLRMRCLWVSKGIFVACGLLSIYSIIRISF